jgi:hypothetical protein
LQLVDTKQNSLLLLHFQSELKLTEMTSDHISSFIRLSMDRTNKIIDFIKTIETAPSEETLWALLFLAIRTFRAQGFSSEEATNMVAEVIKFSYMIPENLHFQSEPK